jgi:hypothetical protein
LGYVANETVFFSGSERKKHSANGKSQRLHRILDCILESFKAAQLPGALANTKIRLGREEKVVNLYVPLQFIIGDVEGGDQLCSRWSYRLKTCRRMCRTCDVSTLNCNKTTTICKRIEVAKIKELYERQDLEALKMLCQRPTFNAFYDIDCGKDPYGIFSMVHTEGLHALEIGVMKYMVEILMKELPTAQHGTLDGLVKKLNYSPNQHGYIGFPRCTWPDGVTSLARLTGDQRVGKMFAILLVALTKEGQAFFEKYLPGGNNTWQRLVYCFEQMLCYWAWLKQDHYWMANDEEACQAAIKSIRIMARQLQTLWPRREGLQWALTKLHEMFHVPRDIHRNGKHYNVHSGPQEHNHMAIKAAALKTQRQKHKIDLQTGERIVDRLILQRAYDRVTETVWNMDQEVREIEQNEAGINTSLEVTEPTQEVVQNATKGFVVMTQERMTNKKARTPPILSNIKWNKSKRKNQLTAKVSSERDILAFLVEQYFLSYRKSVVNSSGLRLYCLKLRCFTEYKQNGIVYRCHPNYRGDRPYYDWCYVHWENNDGSIVQLLARIHLFLQTPTGEIKALIQSVDARSEKEYSVFATKWFMENKGPRTNLRPIFHIVEVETLGDYAMVIPDDSSIGCKYIHIHNRCEWPDFFQTMPLPPDPILLPEIPDVIPAAGVVVQPLNI